MRARQGRQKLRNSNSTQLLICNAIRENSSFVFYMTISILDIHFYFAFFAFLFSVLSVRKRRTSQHVKQRKHFSVFLQ